MGVGGGAPWRGGRVLLFFPTRNADTTDTGRCCRQFSAGHAGEPGHAPPAGHGHGGHDDVAETFAFQDVEYSSTAKNAFKSIAVLLLVFVFLQLTEIASAVEGTKAEQEKQLEHYGIFLMLVLLVLGMISGYVLEELHINVIAEAGGVLMVGIIAGWLIVEDEETGVAMDSTGELEHVTKFDVNFFFLMLLPPIILDAGFNMDEMQRRKLFQNIGGVCACAFGGTLISTILIALTMYAAGEAAQVVEKPLNDADIKHDDMSNTLGFTLTESLIFGSLISATDPVTVLAIFGKMGADRDLYSLVFGESVLNDAVAIVLYKTVSAFNPNTCDLSGPDAAATLDDGRHMSFPAPGMPPCAAGFSSVVSAVGMFLKIFSGSLGVGCLMAATASLVFKHLDLTHEEFFPMENVFLFAFPYMAWMLAESLELSGIVAILFCGFGMDVYAFINLSEATQEMIKKMVKVMAFGCETFVFVYMGMALSLFEQAWFTMPAVGISIISMLYSRALNVYPICALVNMNRPARRAVKPAVQHVVWYSGLRGGIAFALGLAALTDFSCRVPTCLCILEMDDQGKPICSEEVYDPWKEIRLPESLSRENSAAVASTTTDGKTMCGQYLFDEEFWAESSVQEPQPTGEPCTPQREWTNGQRGQAQRVCRDLNPEEHPEHCEIEGAIEACCLTTCGEPDLEMITSLEQAKEYCKCQKCETWELEDGQRTGTCKEFVACLNTEGEGKEACACPAGYSGAGQGILTITLVCVIFCVMVLGGGAYHVMSHFGVIGIDKARADRIQKLEEKEDFMIMMAERQKSKFLNLDAQVITPFLTWQVSLERACTFSVVLHLCRTSCRSCRRVCAFAPSCWVPLKAFRLAIGCGCFRGPTSLVTRFSKRPQKHKGWRCRWRKATRPILPSK